MTFLTHCITFVTLTAKRHRPLQDTSFEQTRSDEEARLAARWMAQLEQYVTSIDQQAFRAAQSHAGLADNASVGLSQLDRVMEVLREQFPEVTLKLMSRASLMDLGLVGYALISSGTLGKSLETLQRFHEFTSLRFTLDITRHDDMMMLRPVPHFSYLSEFESVAEDCLAGVVNTISQLCEDLPIADEASVHFSYPPPAHRDVYHEVFTCRCHFNSNATALYFPASWQNARIKSADPVVAAICNQTCDQILGLKGRSTNISEAVKRLLLTRVDKPMLSIEDAASQLGMTVNQLRKRLYRESTSYKKLILDVRMALAKHYLQLTSLSVQEIAYLLGYSQPSAFSRAYTIFFGSAPSHDRHAIFSGGD